MLWDTWILSNSDVKGKDENDNFFDTYANFNIQRVDARRSINANWKKGVEKLLITNQVKVKNMSEQFKIFLSQLSEMNATLDYFTDFKKIKVLINCNQAKPTKLPNW